MSLINDALKRASQTTKDRPSQATLPTAMEPVREAARTKSNFALLGVLAVVAVVILAASGWFFRQWYRQRHAHSARPPVVASWTVVQKLAPIVPKPAPANPVSGQHPVAASAVTGASVVSQSAVSNGSPIVPPPAHPPVAAAPPPPQPVPVLATVPPPVRTTAAQPAVPFPKLQVKGIFYNRKRPYALINGDTVGEGDRVLGVRVVQIQPDRVVLELNGKVKQLLVGE
jgi:hypothetical protein